MATTVEHLFEKALELDNDHRIELAELLMESVTIDPEILAEQLEIAKRRVDEIESGRVTAIPGDEAFRMIREALVEKRLGA